MSTTRRRVNLTLTEMEERFLDAITTAGAPERLAFLQYLSNEQGEGADVTEAEAAEVPVPNFADVVHLVMRLGIDQIENGMAEISYAAEAAAYTPEDIAQMKAMEQYFISVATQSEE